MTDIYPIKGPISATPYIFYILMALSSLILLSIVLLLFWKKWRVQIYQYFINNKETTENIDEIEALRKKYLQKMNELKKFIQSEEYDYFFQETAHYLKDFYGLCGKYEIKEMTSFEIKKLIMCPELDIILEICDRIKFSKQTKSPQSDCHTVALKCESFISNVQFNK